jgi:predicted enzyme related to lactoylglutathione lyase
VFGWAVEDDGGMVRFRDPAGTLVGAFVCELPPASTGGTTLYLAADDIDAVVARAVEAGAAVVQSRTLVAPGVGYRALLRDPAGSLVGVFERWREPEDAD